MPNISALNPPDVAPIFAALGDARRLSIINRLQEAPNQSVTDICQGFDLARQGVSRHLRVLEDAKIVQARRLGRETRYSLDIETLTAAKAYLTRAASQWDDALGRLETHITD